MCCGMEDDTDMSAKELDSLLISSKNFFQEKVETAVQKRGIKTIPQAVNYLVDLLEHYMFTDNLFEKDQDNGKHKKQTLAEMYLTAQQAEQPPEKRISLLKKLGDTSLYMSGFFSDSLKRKIIDVDYYINMGGTAYGTLAATTSTDLNARVFEEFSEKFVDFMDVLTLISQESAQSSNKDLLRLYDRYMLTGSELAKEELQKQGLLNAEIEKRKKAQ